jgi:NAD(P)-dependent dehydrogenase (short-subunit alcohol dehydrogenase family)
MRLDDKRVLVVGASSGIGRAVGLAAAAEGARVAFAARRAERLADAVVQAGGGAVAVPCDARDEAACEGAVARTVEAFGGLDAFVYCAGISPVRKFADADAALWSEVLGTNLVGAALVARAAIPHLAASQGRGVFLSSSSVARPYPALVVYAASKAAVEEMALGLRAEHPEIRWSVVVVGPTAGTEFADSWDPEVAGEMFPVWYQKGFIEEYADGPMEPSFVAESVLHALTSPGRVDSLTVMPR